MGCCESKETPIQRISQNGEPAVPIRAKRPRDLLFLILYIAMLGGMGYIAFICIKNGDPSRYLHGVDSWGNICGKKNNEIIPGVNTSGLDRLEYTYELRMSFSDMRLALDPSNLWKTGSGAAVLCVKECPVKLIQCKQLLSDNTYNLSMNVINERICTMSYGWIPAHTHIFNRCVPLQLLQVGNAIASTAIQAAGASDLLSSSNNQTNGTSSAQQNSAFSVIAHQMVTSVVNNWTSIVYMVLISLGISLLMIVLLQIFTRVIVVLIVILAGIGSVAATSYLWYCYAVSTGLINSTDVENTVNAVSSITGNISVLDVGNLLNPLSVDPSIRDFQYLLPLCIVVTVATLIILILLVWVRKSLCLVVKLFDEASLAVFNMPGVLLQPFITLISILVVITYFLIIGAYIFSIEVPKVDISGMVSFVQNPDLSTTALIAPHIFGCLWMMEFVSGCQQVIIAEAVSSWFFNQRQKTCKYDMCPTLRPTLHLILFNLGSVALGSLVIAIVQFLRVILAYIQRQLRGKESKTVRFVLKCMACCLACFEKVLKYVSRNAYICVAMYGDSFCTGAKHAVTLLIKNAQHVLALNCVSGFCLLLGKVAVVVLTAFVGVAWFTAKLGTSASAVDYGAPLTISCLCSFVIASAFFNVYSMAIDTIFLCFCDDQERNNGSDRPYFSSVALQKYMTRPPGGKTKKNKKTPAKSSRTRSIHPAK
ncbi:choline transporter-like protein 2 [Ciona intestinalis]